MLINSLRQGMLPSRDKRKELGDAGPDFDLGIHLNLTQGRPLTAGFPPALLTREGTFRGTFGLFSQLIRSPQRFQHPLRLELAAQISRMCDVGVCPTHLNGHQYVEMFPGVRELIPDLVKQFNIPIIRVAHERRPTLGISLLNLPQRLLANVKARYGAAFRRLAVQAGLKHPGGYCGASHAGRIDRELFERFLQDTPPGMMEVALHPGESGSPSSAAEWTDPLFDLRIKELNLLTSDTLRGALSRSGFRLGRLAQLA